MGQCASRKIATGRRRSGSSHGKGHESEDDSEPADEPISPLGSDMNTRAKDLYLTGVKCGAASLKLKDKLALAQALTGREERSIRPGPDRSSARSNRYPQSLTQSMAINSSEFPTSMTRTSSARPESVSSLLLVHSQAGSIAAKDYGRARNSSYTRAVSGPSADPDGPGSNGMRRANSSTGPNNADVLLQAPCGSCRRGLENASAVLNVTKMLTLTTCPSSPSRGHPPQNRLVHGRTSPVMGYGQNRQGSLEDAVAYATNALSVWEANDGKGSPSQRLSYSGLPLEVRSRREDGGWCALSPGNQRPLLPPQPPLSSPPQSPPLSPLPPPAPNQRREQHHYPHQTPPPPQQQQQQQREQREEGYKRSATQPSSRPVAATTPTAWSQPCTPTPGDRDTAPTFRVVDARGDTEDRDVYGASASPTLAATAPIAECGGPDAGVPIAASAEAPAAASAGGATGARRYLPKWTATKRPSVNLDALPKRPALKGSPTSNLAASQPQPSSSTDTLTVPAAVAAAATGVPPATSTSTSTCNGSQVPLAPLDWSPATPEHHPPAQQRPPPSNTAASAVVSDSHLALVHGCRTAAIGSIASSEGVLDVVTAFGSEPPDLRTKIEAPPGNGYLGRGLLQPGDRRLQPLAQRHRQPQSQPWLQPLPQGTGLGPDGGDRASGRAPRNQDDKLRLDPPEVLLLSPPACPITYGAASKSPAGQPQAGAAGGHPGALVSVDTAGSPLSPRQLALAPHSPAGRVCAMAPQSLDDAEEPWLPLQEGFGAAVGGIAACGGSGEDSLEDLAEEPDDAGLLGSAVSRIPGGVPAGLVEI